MSQLEIYISEFSRYVITLLMILYTYESFAVFRFAQEERRKGIYARQSFLMFAFHFCCFVTICFETGDINYLFFYAFQQIALYAFTVLYRMLYPKSNRLVSNNMCMLLCIGLVIQTRLDMSKAIKQFIIAAGSLAIALVIPFFVHNFKLLKRMKWIYALTGVAALGIVMILGQTTYGSKLSYSIAGITFQPSGFFEVFTTAVVAAAHVISLVISKDLGSALIFFIVYVLMVFVATRNFLYLLAGAVGGSGAAYVAYRVFRHVQVRVEAWRDPWSVIDSNGFQITQSLFAISSGGLFGLGLYRGTPNSIPFVETDFIFSAIAEELGIVAAICLLLICVSTFLMFMNIASGMNDTFYQLTAFGLGVTYIFQVFLTVGGGTKFIPLTGVTLPLISYGGSSILTTIVMFAIAQGLHIIRQDEEEALKTALKKKRLKKQRMRRQAEGGSKRRSYPAGDEIEDEEESEEEK